VKKPSALSPPEEVADPDVQVEATSEGGAYFTSRPKNIDFIPSGSTLFDCILGGGYPLGRMVNIVGNKSTGKTLLAIEACANFIRDYPDGTMWYREAEAAFDQDYARALGMPVEQIDFDAEILTVEDWYEDLLGIVQNYPDNKPGLYILDSLDALSDRAELDRDIDEGSYGANKAKKIGELFRRLVQHLEDKRICVMIISQVRDNIGVKYGKKTTRSGGHAMDFYASQIVDLTQIKTYKKTKKGVERVVGVWIKAKMDKCKVGFPYRDCTFPILFGYGIDDVRSCIEWLLEVKAPSAIDMTIEEAKKTLKGLDAMADDEYEALSDKVTKACITRWYDIEDEFLPTKRKY
jgi:recombination protein RecA